MWLSKEIASGNKKQEVSHLGEVTKADSKNVSLQGEREYRNLPTVCPFGIVSVPKIGSKSVVIPIDDGFAFSGVISDSTNLEPGELMLYSAGGASIVLKNSGKVLINGNEVTT